MMMVVVVVVMGGQTVAVALILTVRADGDDAVGGGGRVSDDDGLQSLHGATLQRQPVCHAPVSTHTQQLLSAQQLRLGGCALLHTLLHGRKLRRRRFLVGTATTHTQTMLYAQSTMKGGGERECAHTKGQGADKIESKSAWIFFLYNI